MNIMNGGMRRYVVALLWASAGVIDLYFLRAVWVSIIGSIGLGAITVIPFLGLFVMTAVINFFGAWQNYRNTEGAYPKWQATFLIYRGIIGLIPVVTVLVAPGSLFGLWSFWYLGHALLTAVVTIYGRRSTTESKYDFTDVWKRIWKKIRMPYYILLALIMVIWLFTR